MKRFSISVNLRTVIAFVLSLVAVFILWLTSPLLPSQAQSQVKIFDEIWQTVNNNFFDSKFNGVNWQAMGNRYKPQASKAKSQQEFAVVINKMLSELRTSHTRYYTPTEQAYYQLLGIFQPRGEKVRNRLKTIFPKQKFEYTDIGVFTKIINNKTFVSAILDNGPAAKAGLKVGDAILSVNNQKYQPIQSFSQKAGQKVKILIQRSSDANSQQEITVTPQIYDATKMFFDAQQNSTQIIQHQGKKIGYVHIWANAADPTQEELVNDLLFNRLKDADGLILDLRDGWGGGTTNYLNVFTGEGPSVTSIPRNRKRTTYEAIWNKPVVLLINEGSRSSKEIIAYGFQQYKIGSTIGTKTTGAVVAGSAFIMPDGSLLYVAVADVLVDNKRLEGKGVTPDIIVPFNLEYAQGADPQKQKALEEMEIMLSDKRKAP